MKEENMTQRILRNQNMNTTLKNAKFFKQNKVNMIFLFNKNKSIQKNNRLQWILKTLLLSINYLKNHMIFKNKNKLFGTTFIFQRLIRNYNKHTELKKYKI